MAKIPPLDRVGGVVDRRWVKGQKAGFSGAPEIELSCVSPAQKYDGWLQSGLYFTEFQESASRAVLGGTRYPLYFKNGAFLRDFHRGFASNPPLPSIETSSTMSSGMSTYRSTSRSTLCSTLCLTVRARLARSARAAPFRVGPCRPERRVSPRVAQGALCRPTLDKTAKSGVFGNARNGGFLRVARPII